MSKFNASEAITIESRLVCIDKYVVIQVFYTFQIVSIRNTRIVLRLLKVHVDACMRGRTERKSFSILNFNIPGTICIDIIIHSHMIITTR